ncbi:glucose-6-phosphate exchanger SLC37A2 isoform X1 [Drosophila sulfurigaster albostrigata]|uniref:Sugar phosphate exchanger 3 n=1 Tax=Drosophila albomicans TaxID=7291 RepID=A0A6P8WFZ9_DROAB|nr:glucose-6-phosphate exchanger SLC37A2 isoform X1 [Drosophila albomicans]XP_034102576.1 glucose-6-phosphate exchanger SLC37A2 isoform X1 [Drosophila albomicans]XP_034102577.1 glucose-6-phosphate exchanger SLC37A2 isoform X1 [Drosophila albomicans]XP_062128146.1 glucose-6-phosphate exchanger SLC37A2 isoform X1 [Drosophila sulfurigaster albostrigata]XP_062128147.1 glucose-6-phosphate exchanger SLC37A2 isoform X1 [Drosophila sulfurigaster albostrigata]XP_062128148.1 glucose-6-phosphate exchange
MRPSASRTRKMSNNYNDIPIGIRLLQSFSRQCPRFHARKELCYKMSIFLLTFLAYACYHMSRKPISVVKSVLHGNCSTVQLQDAGNCGYAPFDGPDSKTLFGMLDSAFLFSYAISMFASGFIAERVSLRYFLSMGMIMTGVFTYLFGLARTSNIHSLAYFVLVQIFAGIFQTTGWPGVVTLVGRWFGKKKRGLIFGIWNSHTSIGNILGTLIAAHYVETDWALSFVVPGIIIGAVGFLLFLFLVDQPEIVGCHPQPAAQERRISNDSDADENDDDEEQARRSEAFYAQSGYADSQTDQISYRPTPTERTPILARPQAQREHTSHGRPIGLVDALYIPGVVEFSLCLFFTKLVSYTFMYWLPLYIQSSSTLGPELSADLSTLFDVGGILGAIAAGYVSDLTGMSATVCTVMLFFASPILLMYQQYGALSVTISVLLLIAVGIFVNGPYALITTSVSAELGQHSSLEGNSNALATVTAIIDGTGSIGAAVGPLLAGVISSHSWQNVFYMLIVSDIIAMVLLMRLVVKECTAARRSSNRIRIE